LHKELGNHAAAEQALHRAIAIAEELIAEFPTNLDDQLYLAYCTTHLGELLRDQGRLKESGDQIRRSLTIDSKLYDESPQGRYRQHCAEIRRVLAEVVIAEDGNRAEAEKYLLEAINLEAGITADFRTGPEYREPLGCPHIILGELLDERGEREEAERQMRLGLQLWKDLAQEFPTDTHAWLHTTNWEDQAWGHASLAGLLRHHHELAAAEEHCRQAIDLSDQVVIKRPNLSASRNNLAIRHTDLGELLREKTDNVGAAKQFREAIGILNQLARDVPKIPEYRYELARAHFNLAELAAETGQNQEAEDSYRTALTLYEKVTTESPSMASYGEALAECSFALAHVLLVTGRGQQAADVCHKALQMPTDRPAVYNRLAWLLVVCPDRELRDPLLAEKLATKAVQARPEARNYQTTLAAAR